MRNHDTADTFVNELPERIKFNVLQSFHGVLNHRKVVVGVDISIAMTGKMFATRHHPCSLQTAHIGNGFTRSFFAIFTK